MNKEAIISGLGALLFVGAIGLWTATKLGLFEGGPKQSEAPSTEPEVPAAAEEMKIEATLSEADLAELEAKAQELLNGVRKGDVARFQKLNRYNNEGSIIKAIDRLGKLLETARTEKAAGNLGGVEASLNEFLDTHKELTERADTVESLSEKEAHVRETISSFEERGVGRLELSKTEFSRIKERLTDAKRIFSGDQFEEASGAFDQISEDLGSLDDVFQSEFDRRLSEAEARFDAAEPDMVPKLEIQPTNDYVKQLIGRSARRAVVAGLERQAESLESSGGFGEALALYERIQAIDSDTQDISKRIERVRLAFNKDLYRQRMKSALTSLKNEAFEEAIEWATQAESIAVTYGLDAQSALDLKRDVKEARRKRDIADLYVDMLAAEEKNEWGMMLSTAMSILELSPNRADVEKRRAFAYQKIKDEESLINFMDAARGDMIDAKEDLDKEVAAHAVEILKTAMERYEPLPGHEIFELFEQAEALNRDMLTPINTILVSDGKTDVVLLGYGKLGRFRKMEVELTPGRYEAACSRNGYVDEKIPVTIYPGKKPDSALRLVPSEKL